MKIAIPRERKTLEGRVALTPDAVELLIKSGHELILEQDAGLNSGYQNQDYQAVGAKIVENLADVYQADLIVKVKEPMPEELTLLKPQQLLFCYLHLAAYPRVLTALLQQQVTALAFETLTVNQRLPLLAPMSAVAGRIAVQLAIQYLQKNHQGAGVLLGGHFNIYHRGKVLVLGAGVAGSQAALMASALGAEVFVFDKSLEALDALYQKDSNLQVQLFDTHKISQLLASIDVVIGAVLIKGANAPKVLSIAQQQLLAKGRVIVDIAIDQGGCIEGIAATDWQQPAYQKNNLTYIAVSNMPAAVPRTATQLLSQAITPYVLALANGKLATDTVLQTAIALQDGKIIHSALQNFA
ncbi:MAG TPA: alanine dehydrogenase [Agitococcus sp.]|nr:alanine dehydrogenase [Agitococcus sp.]